LALKNLRREGLARGVVVEKGLIVVDYGATAIQQHGQEAGCLFEFEDGLKRKTPLWRALNGTR
jgi:hypothetical protein